MQHQKLRAEIAVSGIIISFSGAKKVIYPVQNAPEDAMRQKIFPTVLRNFPAVKFLIEKEGYEFGTFSNYEESVNALGWAKKNKNGEMEKYLDDKISGWTAAGVWTRNILLAPLMILVLLAAH